VPRWVTFFGRVNHLGAEPGTQAYSTRACPLCRLECALVTVLCYLCVLKCLFIIINEYLAKSGRVNRHDIAWHTSPCPWSRSVRWLPGWMDWLAEISEDKTYGMRYRIRDVFATMRYSLQMAAFTLLLLLERRRTKLSL